LVYPLYRLDENNLVCIGKQLVADLKIGGIDPPTIDVERMISGYVYVVIDDVIPDAKGTVGS